MYTDVILREMDTILADEYDLNKIKQYMNIFEKKEEYQLV